MNHLARACKLIEAVQRHLDYAKGKPEAPVQVIEFLQVSLHDIWLILDHHARRRQTYD